MHRTSDKSTTPAAGLRGNTKVHARRVVFTCKTFDAKLTSPSRDVVLSLGQQKIEQIMCTKMGLHNKLTVMTEAFNSDDSETDV